MISLNFGQYSFSIKEENGKRKILDIVRKKYIQLTQEEWVRQNIVHYLTKDLNYPKSMIAIEKTLMINGLRKRYDIVVYNKQTQPWMLIECKEPEVEITDKTLQQLLSYHHTLQCKYWILTNGNTTYCATIDNNAVNWLAQLPEYE